MYRALNAISEESEKPKSIGSSRSASLIRAEDARVQQLEEELAAAKAMAASSRSRTSSSSTLRAERAEAENQRLREQIAAAQAMSARGHSRTASSSTLRAERAEAEGEKLKEQLAKLNGGASFSRFPPSSSASRARELAAYEEIEKLKRELAEREISANQKTTSKSRQRLEAAEAEIADLRRKARAAPPTSSRTRREMDSMQQRVAKLKLREERFSTDRATEIKSVLLNSYQLDLAFLVDVTGSMQDCIDMVRDNLQYIVEKVQQVHPRVQLRAAFVGYRDYDDAAPVQIVDFMDLKSCGVGTWRDALSKIHADGGGDEAEDVFTGLEAVSQRLSWASGGGRLLVHVADAPCHGRRFHDHANDDYLDGDVHGRRIETILASLKDPQGVGVQMYYFFNPKSSSTDKMLCEFQNAVGEDGSKWILSDSITAMKSIPEKIAIKCSQSVSQSLKEAKLGVKNGVISVPISSAEPQWDSIAKMRCIQYKLKKIPIDALLNILRNKEPLLPHHECMVKGESHIQIALQPFSSDGAGRWPYHARVYDGHTEASNRFVVKRFKMPIGVPTDKVHKKESYASQMEMPGISAFLAQEFNRQIESASVRAKKISFALVTFVEVWKEPTAPTPTYYNMEKFLRGEFIKYTNNAGYVNTKDYQATLQAFSHWTYDRSNGFLMVTDLQGVLDKKNDKFWLTDPAIHCEDDLLSFGKTNLGKEGFNVFFETHVCNSVCKALHLKRHPSQPADII